MRSTSWGVPGIVGVGFVVEVDVAWMFVGSAINFKFLYEMLYTENVIDWKGGRFELFTRNTIRICEHSMNMFNIELDSQCFAWKSERYHWLRSSHMMLLVY